MEARKQREIALLSRLRRGGAVVNSRGITFWRAGRPAVQIMRFPWPLVCALIALLLAAPVRSAGQIATPQAPALTVQSQLVVLDVVVTDAKGHVVSGLTPDDFVVYENGVRQDLRNVTATDAAAPVPETPRHDRNGHDDWGQAPLTMIVVDELDTPFNETAYSRDCVRNFLRRQPELLREPTILLWLNDRGVRALTPFTRDREALLSALRKQPPSLPSMLMRGDRAEQVAASFAALQQAALFSRGEAGRKQILWVGRSFPSIDPVNLTDYQRSLLRRAVRSTVDVLLGSRVTLYVVDPTVTGSAREDDDGVAQDVDTLQLETASTVQDPFASSFNLNLFVNETGGKYFRGRNDLDAAIAESQQRARSFYTLSYVPSQRIEAGSYRRIDVRLRHPGLFVQAKKGYYPEAPAVPASKLETSLDEKELRFDLYESLVTGMQYTGVGVHAEQCAFDQRPNGATCALEADTGSLTFTPNPEAQDERTTVLVVAGSLDSRGKLLSDTASRLTVGIPEKLASGIATGYTRLQIHTVITPAATALRISVRDASGRIGTAEVPVATITGHRVAAPPRTH